MGSSAYRSRVVHIGDIPLGGDYPVRLQSMTSTNTMDTLATVEQSIRMIEAGCEYVRITAPGIKEAENLRIIKKELRSRGYNTPLIADIHYQPRAALIAAAHVEKVRINPGNYVDRKRGKLNYTETEYANELEKIGDRLKPLIDVCKRNGTALRIGSNQGSLSERIMLRFGDTPAGMVESALEFALICKSLDFDQLVLSMKASNVKVMIQANRLLVSRMKELGLDYPLHLGVTEAGDAEDGRMKSAAGIGPLLMDGIGDTIRVSLTEDPEFEIPVARQIVDFTTREWKELQANDGEPLTFNPFEYVRRNSRIVMKTGGGKPPVVVTDIPEDFEPDNAFKQGFEPDLFAEKETGRIFLQENIPTKNPGETPVRYIRSVSDLKKKIPEPDPEEIFVFEMRDETHNQTIRNWFGMLKKNNCPNPVILHKGYEGLTFDQLLIKASVDFSYFLSDGLPDGIWISSAQIPPHQLAELSFGILQATGERISKTDYIACPSCGRTLFNIQTTLRVIKEKTAHLKGLKIGVMGCCVNGPGEMADAHYGYVGAGKGKITLYKGKQIMKTGIREELAVDELIRLIRENGDWD